MSAAVRRFLGGQVLPLLARDLAASAARAARQVDKKGFRHDGLLYRGGGEGAVNLEGGRGPLSEEGLPLPPSKPPPFP